MLAISVVGTESPGCGRLGVQLDKARLGELEPRPGVIEALGGADGTDHLVNQFIIGQHVLHLTTSASGLLAWITEVNAVASYSAPLRPMDPRARPLVLAGAARRDKMSLR